MGQMILKWVAIQPPVGNKYYAGKSGNITCFVIVESISKAKMFKLIAMLPGIEQDISLTGSLEDLKSIAEEKFKTWLDAADLIDEVTLLQVLERDYTDPDAIARFEKATDNLEIDSFIGDWVEAIETFQVLADIIRSGGIRQVVRQ